MTKFVRLPNHRVVMVDALGYVKTQVELSLSSIINNNAEQFRQALSEEATGSPEMRDIQYSIQGYRGDYLTLLVTGNVEAIGAIPQVFEDQLPTQEFEAEVTRIGYGCRTFRLSAKTEDDARDIAEDDAGNHLYSEHASDYLVEVRKVP